MSTSTLKTRTFVLLLGATLACGVTSAQAQYSPAARQALITILTEAPADEQPLIINAIRALGPQRAELALRRVSTVPPAERQAFGQFVTQVLQQIPQENHQAFIDGLFDVSPQERQYVEQVAAAAKSLVDGDRDATDMINGYRERMLGVQRNAFEVKDYLLGQQAQGTGRALGATTIFNGNGFQVEGYTGPVGTHTYFCFGYLVQSTSSPDYRCVEVHAP